MTNLVFSKIRNTGQPVSLIFNETDEAVAGSVVIDFAAVLPALEVVVHIGRKYELTADVTLPALAFNVEADWDSRVSRPTVGQVRESFQVAKPSATQLEQYWQQAVPHRTAFSAQYDDAAALSNGAASGWQDAETRAQYLDSSFSDAAQLAASSLLSSWRDAERVKARATSTDQNARPVRSGFASSFYDAAHSYRNSNAARFQDAAGQWRSFVEVFHRAINTRSTGDSLYQDARRPPAGISQGSVVEQLVPCYVPPLGNLVHLLFDAIRDTSGNLLFVCDPVAQVPDVDVDLPPSLVVVPKQEVYVVINSIQLRRIEGNIAIQALNASMSLDRSSWTWGVTINLPAQELANLQPINGEPATLELTVNGVPYMLIVNAIGRARAFATSEVSVSCRGLNSLLDAPYAPVQTFTNTQARTAQQLANDILTENNVSLGWTVNWGLTDWNVPAGAFVHNGSYMSALTAIAAAAGGYIAPHPSLQTLYVLPSYPQLPRDWAAITPDFEIPADVVVTENVQWFDRPEYNRVFVSGVGVGSLVQATISGTAGDLVYPIVADPLITHVDAGRQRAVSILGQGGKGSETTISMPVLPITGIIPPGKFIRYTEGAQILMGLSRAVQVEMASDGATLTQSITIEVRP